MEGAILVGLVLLAIPFILPIVSLVSLANVKRRLNQIEDLLGTQQSTIEALAKRMRELKTAAAAAPAAAPRAEAPAAATVVAPRAEAPAMAPPPRPEREQRLEGPPKPAAPPVVEPPKPAPPPPTSPAVFIDEKPAMEEPLTPQASHAVEAPPIIAASPAAAAAVSAAPPRREPPPARPITPPEPPPPPPEPFDWEQLIGVKMFSAVAGIAAVLATVLFLKNAIDKGWLQPPLRVAIGVITGIALLVVCELKAAKKYRVTANALDAAAIAILFASFFSAHALWDLISAPTTFGLLAMVTVVAVLLSIRHDSIFIALLGLVGGFATPMLLSTGENRPISLFTYLLLLNIGLAWVAARKRWSILTIITLVFTAFYQWGWVIKFLDASQLSLAMGIFLVFAVVGFAGIAVTRRGREEDAMGASLDRLGVAAAAMPLLFAVYLSAVPAYGLRVGMLFGFLLLIDAALTAVAIGRRDELPHAIGGVATLVVFAIWLSVSYASRSWTTVVWFASAFVVLYAAAPAIVKRLGRAFEGIGRYAVLAAPTLLFVFVVLARIEPQTAAPLRLFGPMTALLAILAWRAIAAEEFAVYYVAAFFGVAAEATWSATHLSADNLREGMVLYLAFAAYYLGVPLVARRLNRELEPRWGGGAVLIAGLGLLLFLASGPRTPAALWGLAVLLAVLNAGVFVESAAGDLPLLAFVGGLLSWLVLGVWWLQSAATIGVIPSLFVLVLLTLIMLAGHAWAHLQSGAAGTEAAERAVGFRQGAFLGLIGHLFLFALALQPEWTLPPWPLFGALVVMTLAVSVTSLAIGRDGLHAAGAVAAAVVVFAWTSPTDLTTYEWTALVAGEAPVAYALAWMFAFKRRGGGSQAPAVAAGIVLFFAELVAANAAQLQTSPPLAATIVTHVANVSLILWLAWEHEWRAAGVLAVGAAWLETWAWQSASAHTTAADWSGGLAMAFALYAVFSVYPFVLGGRARDARNPFLTAVAGSAFFFFTARTALLQGGYGGYLGAIPVGEGLVMTLLLRQLLRLQPEDKRDLGRLAIVAGAALAFATVAIPLQLRHQWITIGWALEGVALAWAYRRIPHRGLFLWSFALLAAVFARLVLNPAVFVYEPRGMRIVNWYLYTYLVCGASMILAAWFYRDTDDNLGPLPRALALSATAGIIVLFWLLNIEIADYYATGREITFRFGVTLAQDLTYTIGWLVFGMILLTAGIFARIRPARVAAVALIAVTALKGFLYDMRSLGGLYRVGSLVGLAISLSLVALALQKFVLHRGEEE